MNPFWIRHANDTRFRQHDGEGGSEYVWDLEIKWNWIDQFQPIQFPGRRHLNLVENNNFSFLIKFPNLRNLFGLFYFFFFLTRSVIAKLKLSKIGQQQTNDEFTIFPCYRWKAMIPPSTEPNFSDLKKINRNSGETYT